MVFGHYWLTPFFIHGVNVIVVFDKLVIFSSSLYIMDVILWILFKSHE